MARPAASRRGEVCRIGADDLLVVFLGHQVDGDVDRPREDHLMNRAFVVASPRFIDRGAHAKRARRDQNEVHADALVSNLGGSGAACCMASRSLTLGAASRSAVRGRRSAGGEPPSRGRSRGSRRRSRSAGFERAAGPPRRRRDGRAGRVPCTR